MTPTTPVNKLVDHLFRHEAGKLVAVFTRVFGTEHIDLAEDIVQDALIEALQHWQYNGVPDNPSGWLYRVAKNKALNVLNREIYKKAYIKEITRLQPADITTPAAANDFFSEQEIRDDQLRMIFTCCHAAISPDSQIALALKTLCGFSIPEIAKAFLTTEENIHKRLVRARQKIRDDKIPFEVPAGKDLDKRLNTVLETIYLLFNEGYSASKGNDIIRYELCEEAIRLAQIIAEHKRMEKKENVFALLALMLLNASRFKARQDEKGNLLTMEEQNRSLWDVRLQAMGMNYLNQSTQNESISTYHILAAISAEYCIAPAYASINWENILMLYNSLVQLDSSPVVLLNRAIVVEKVKGAAAGLATLEEIQHLPSLQSYYLFYATQAEFNSRLQQWPQAKQALEKAIQLAPMQSEKDWLIAKLEKYKTI